MHRNQRLVKGKHCEGRGMEKGPRVSLECLECSNASSGCNWEEEPHRRSRKEENTCGGRQVKLEVTCRKSTQES